MLKLIVGIVLGVSVGSFAQGVDTLPLVGQPDPGRSTARWLDVTTTRATLAAASDPMGNAAVIRVDAKGRVIARCDVEP